MKKFLSLLMLLTVAIPSLMATDFKKVTSNEELQDGANYILVAVAKYGGVTSNYVMKDGFTSLDTNQNSGAIVATATNDVITLPDGAVTVTIKAVEDKYRLYYNGSTVQGYISANTGAKNKLRISNSESDYELMTINVGTTEVDIQSVSYFTSGTTNYSKLSFAAGSKTTGNFNFYTSTYNTSKIFLYREVEPTDVASIAEYNALDLGTIVRFGCPLTISYANRDNIFAQDADGNGIFMYSKNGIGAAANGKVIPANELIGKVASYNSNKQLNFTDYTLPALTDGDAINPITVQFGALNDSYLYKYVMIPDVTLTKGADVMLYNVNGVTGFLANEYGLKNWPTLIDGKTFNIYGIYVNMGDSKGLYFIDAKAVVATLDSPTLSVEGGTYNTEQIVNITAADGAEVRYTTNDESDIKGGVEGVDYTVGNTVSIDKSCTLRVVAVKDGGFSPVVTETYVMKTAKPEITMGDDKKVSITTDYQNGVTIYYTTDGTTVTAESEVYSEPFTIARGSVVKAVAKYKEFDLSDEVSFNYTQERSVVFDAASTSDFPGIEDKKTLDDTDFTKDGIIVRFEKGTSSSNPNLYYVNDGQIRFYKDNILKISAEGSAIISSVEFKTTTTASNLLKSPQLSSGTYTNDGASGVWKDINAQSATLTNVTQQARLLSIKVNYIVPEEAANVLKINEEGAYYVVNFTLEGVKENGDVLYARTIEDSVEPSDPKKDYFDKGYEDYDLNKFTQRDWVAIAGLKSEYAEKQIATGFVARYDGTKLVPVTNVVPGDGVSVELNTFGVANVFYGNYENTAGLGMTGGYQPFFVKAKVNEVANFVGKVTKDTNEEGAPFRLVGSGKCGVFEGKGVLLEAADGVTLSVSGEDYKEFKGVLVAETNNTLAQCDVKIVALTKLGEPTGVAALKADGKATVYGTEGAVVVNGADGKVMIFDAMGRMVKSVNAEGAATVAMPAGYYIVRTAGTAAKVMVK